MVIVLLHLLSNAIGKAICKSDACIPDLLLDIRIHQRSKDIQDSACQSF